MNKKIELDKKFHQKEYVEYLFSHPELIVINKDYFTNIRLIAIYLRDYKNMKPSDRKIFIYDFVKNNDPNFNEVLDYKRIDRALTQANNKKFKLKNLDPIYIYQEEFDYIFKLTDNDNQRRLLFAILCYWKQRNSLYFFDLNNYFIPNYVVTIPCLKRTSKVKLKKLETIGFLFHDLNNKELIGYTPYKEGSIIAKFIQDIPKIDLNSNGKIEIIDFEELGLYYDYFSNKSNLHFCANCGSIFKIKPTSLNGGNHNIKYCKDCREKEIVYLKLIRCECCGEPKYISVRARRKGNICDECYEIQRQKDRHK